MPLTGLECKQRVKAAKASYMHMWYMYPGMTTQLPLKVTLEAMGTQTLIYHYRH